MPFPRERLSLPPDAGPWPEDPSLTKDPGYLDVSRSIGLYRSDSGLGFHICLIGFGTSFSPRQCLLQGLGVDIGCEVDRAFSPQGVPGGWISDAEELGLESYSLYGFLCSHSHDLARCFPGRATWSTPHHLEVSYDTILETHLQFRRAKLLPICSQADLPG